MVHDDYWEGLKMVHDDGGLMMVDDGYNMFWLVLRNIINMSIYIYIYICNIIYIYIYWEFHHPK